MSHFLKPISQDLCQRCADYKLTIDNLARSVFAIKIQFYLNLWNIPNSGPDALTFVRSLASSVGLSYPSENFEPCHLCFDRSSRLLELETSMRSHGGREDEASDPEPPEASDFDQIALLAGDAEPQNSVDASEPLDLSFGADSFELLE
jgi:hypothetical protein